jgi:hypothetical protein
MEQIIGLLWGMDVKVSQGKNVGQIQLPDTVKIFFLSFQSHKINPLSLL